MGIMIRVRRASQTAPRHGLEPMANRGRAVSKEKRMAYFVTGGTGFIGRYLIENLLKRGEPIYVLVRKGSLKKLDALRQTWGTLEKRVMPVVGDLAKSNLGVSDADLK